MLRLLCALVDLCASVPSHSIVASHVARVLGTIGPRDMGCIALPPFKDEGDQPSERKMWQ